ncbi:MAG: protein kinase [Pirellulaceae bacterium]
MPDAHDTPDAGCDQSDVLSSFAAAWRGGDTPSLESWLKHAKEADRLEQFQQLLSIELQCRSELGHKPTQVEYRHRFPDAGLQIEAAFVELSLKAGQDPASLPTGDSSDSTNGNQPTVDFTNSPSALSDVTPADSILITSLHEPSVPSTSSNHSRQPDASAANQSAFIGRYRIVAQLDEGAFGVVYHARDEQLDRDVAIKVPHAHRLRSAAALQTYLDEAKTLAKLEHPHIIPIFDVGATTEHPCFVVSKLIQGTNLFSLMQQQRLPVGQAIQIVAQLAQALHYAHAQGVVHRDVKPANILIDAQDKAYLADFGIALQEEQWGDGPQLVGTPAYMSPEQIAGTSHRLDGRSDIFSLGVVLYELLTGKRPFRSKNRKELTEQIQTLDPKPLRQFDDRIPASVERICRKAMAKKPSDRYGTAADFANDLSQAMSDIGQDNATSTSAVRNTAGNTGHRMWGILLSMAALAMLAFMLVLRHSRTDRHASQDDMAVKVDSSTTSQDATAALLADFSIMASRQKRAFQPLSELAPLTNGDHVHFSIRLNEPAYVRLLWIDATGEPSELYPLDPEIGDRGSRPVTEIESPPQLDKGWPVEGEGGLETALLLVSKEPLDGINLRQFQSYLPANIGSNSVRRFTATRHQAAKLDVRRSLGKTSEQMDDVVLQLLERLRTHADFAEAVVIPHGDSESPVPPFMGE